MNRRIFIFLCLVLSTANAVNAFRRGAEPAHVRRATKAQNLEQICKSARDYLEEQIEEETIPLDVLQKACGIIIYNKQTSASFLLGIRGGIFLSMKRLEDGSWSLPSVGREGSVSFGLQFGFKEESMIYLIMDEKSLELLETGKLKAGMDLEVALGPMNRRKDVDIVSSAPILAYPGTNKTRGFQAGLSVKGGSFMPSDRDNVVLYGTPDVSYILSQGVNQSDARRPEGTYIPDCSVALALTLNRATQSEGITIDEKKRWHY